MTIDVHAHYIPDILLDYIKTHGDSLCASVETKNGTNWITHKGGTSLPITKEFYELEKRLEDMDKANIDKAVLSISPVYFFYDINSYTALEICKLCNDWVYEFAKKCPERFECMAMVPMQDINLAIEELHRTHTKLGMNAVEIAPVIDGYMLDNPKFFPFFDYCEKNDILLYLHPAQTNREQPYDKYHALNLIGYVQETNWALVRMIFGGIFEKFPNLKVLSSHGGGHFPYQFGRLMHGHDVRNEAKVNITKSPTQYLKNIYFDSITHWTPALQFLVDTFGASHVLMGTDYPYDMADPTPVESIDALKITEKQRTLIKSTNCLNLINKDL